MTPSRALSIVASSALLVLLAGKFPKGEIRSVPYDVVPSASMFDPQLSDNGRWLAFRTSANNMLPGGNDGSADVYLLDVNKGAVIQVSRTLDGGDPALGCVAPAISPTGRYIAYQSSDTGIVENDSPNTADLFLFDSKKGTTVRVSEGKDGGPGSSTSTDGAISKNGRWVAFASLASNLVDGDNNGDRDVFLRNMKKGVTIMLSRDATGAPGDGESEAPAISANGRWVAFASDAALLPEDDNARRDVYLADTKKGTLELVSVNPAGAAGDDDSGLSVDISANGKFVTFTSEAQDLVPGDVAFANVFHRDVKKGLTTLVSAASDGTPASSLSGAHAVSAEGRFVAFQCFANNLVPPDTNAKDDVFLKDVKKGTIERLSLGVSGDDADDTSSFPTISKKGKYVAFQSLASNLLEGGDANTGTDIFVKRR